jgi:hypothetical protein
LTKFPFRGNKIFVCTEIAFLVDVVLCNNYVHKSKTVHLTLTLHYTKHAIQARLKYDVRLHIDPSLHPAVLLEISQTLAASNV